MVVYTGGTGNFAGTPDFSISAVRLAVFVDGDFWHGRTWFAHGDAPKTRRDFWIAKFETNRQRDQRVGNQLRRAGWSCAQDPPFGLTIGEEARLLGHHVVLGGRVLDAVHLERCPIPLAETG